VRTRDWTEYAIEYQTTTGDAGALTLVGGIGDAPPPTLEQLREYCAAIYGEPDPIDHRHSRDGALMVPGVIIDVKLRTTHHTVESTVEDIQRPADVAH
jgi:hypothetical protein